MDTSKEHSTALHNEEVAAAFDEMADLLSIQADNAFRVGAYRRAAQVVRTLPRELAQMHGVEDFDALPGIGADLAAKIEELLRTGNLSALERMRVRIPSGLRELLALPGLGPVRVRALFTGLKVRSVEDLRRALAKGRLSQLRGFGPVLQTRLAQALAERQGAPAQRTPYSVATQYARPLTAYLKSIPGVTRVQIAGSFRRGCETVGDLDVLVCARQTSKPIEALKRYAELDSLTAAGSTRASGVLRNGLQVDVRVLPPASFGAGLHYFTGSRAHTIHMRRRAQERGCKLSEYGLFHGARRLAGASEEELFRALDLPYIPPELREDRGEIEAAAQHALPKLVELADLQGDLHVHTNASDGSATLEQMVTGAQARGLRYAAITDHSKHLGVTHGLDAARLSEQIDAIDRLNETLQVFTVLKGAEVDILEDGRLALEDAILKRLDVVVIAVHSHFGLSEVQQTNRILRALERPAICILAHPFGRLLGSRPPYALDFERVLSAVQQRGCFMEINAQPLRLDLNDVHARAARERGILLSIASDAHSREQFGLLENGIRQARRAWLTRHDVLNARPLHELRALLRASMR
ncbi:MAG: DNA polymerase/3'-5' exonuclease PolX [Steroidobacteraceae bacterium]